jgi:periplasmic copper chaperone A
VSRALPRPAATAPVVLALGLVLSGCGAGFEAQTYQGRVFADGANAAVGAIAVRNLTVLPGDDDGGRLEAGSDADARMTLTNNGGEDDALVEASSPLASSVDLVDGDGSTVDSIDLPRLGTTGNDAGLVLRSLTEDVRPGQYVEVVLRFESSGELTVRVPIAVTGEYDDEREKSDNFHPPGDEAHSE